MSRRKRLAEPVKSAALKPSGSLRLKRAAASVGLRAKLHLGVDAAAPRTARFRLQPVKHSQTPARD
jgi:hypothetical protein